MTQITDEALTGADIRSEPQRIVDEAFLIAYLLTRCAAAAEQVVCMAIEALDSSQLYGRALITKTLSLCVVYSKNETSTDSLDAETLPLPRELKAVMKLEPAARYCFVARSLLEFSLRDCVRLLQTDAVTITNCLITATQRLCQQSGKDNHTYSNCVYLRSLHPTRRFATHTPASHLQVVPLSLNRAEVD